MPKATHDFRAAAKVEGYLAWCVSNETAMPWERLRIGPLQFLEAGRQCRKCDARFQPAYPRELLCPTCATKKTNRTRNRPPAPATNQAAKLREIEP
jgi:hypothetical protein